MRRKQFLAAILVSLSFCFVSGLGYGEIKEKEFRFGTKQRRLEADIQQCRVDYIMMHPDNFLRVHFYYDELGGFAEYFPAGVNTQDKICVMVFDTRDVFSSKTGTMLLLEFKG